MSTALFQTIQISSIWPIDRTLSDATTPHQSKPQSSIITGALLSNSLVSYPGRSLEVSYSSAEM